MKLPENSSAISQKMETFRISNPSMNVSLKELINLLPKDFEKCHFDIGTISFKALMHLVDHKNLSDLSFYGTILLEESTPAEMKMFFESIKKINEVYIFSSIPALNATVKKFIKIGTDAGFVVHYSIRHVAIYNY